MASTPWRAVDLPVEVGERRQPLPVDVSQHGLTLPGDGVHHPRRCRSMSFITATRSPRSEVIATSESCFTPSGELSPSSRVRSPLRDNYPKDQAHPG
jgi:hypothetical protein